MLRYGVHNQVFNRLKGGDALRVGHRGLDIVSLFPLLAPRVSPRLTLTLYSSKRRNNATKEVEVLYKPFLMVGAREVAGNPFS